VGGAGSVRRGGDAGAPSNDSGAALLSDTPARAIACASCRGPQGAERPPTSSADVTLATRKPSWPSMCVSACAVTESGSTTSTSRPPPLVCGAVRRVTWRQSPRDRLHRVSGFGFHGRTRHGPRQGHGAHTRAFFVASAVLMRSVAAMVSTAVCAAALKPGGGATSEMLQDDDGSRVGTVFSTSEKRWRAGLDDSCGIRKLGRARAPSSWILPAVAPHDPVDTRGEARPMRVVGPLAGAGASSLMGTASAGAAISLRSRPQSAW